jgi:hypothetical protein
MAGTPFTIGADASCTDRPCGVLARIIVDPVARAVTHLVVEPKHERKHGRLVPISLVEAVPGGIRLRCTRAEFEELDPAEETQFLPASGWPGSLGYGSEQVLSWRYYGLTRARTPAWPARAWTAPQAWTAASAWTAARAPARNTPRAL